MDSNGSALSMRQRHPVAITLAWFFGLTSAGLSVFYVYMIITAISEWSDYVGHMSGTATAILVVFGLITLFSWGATGVAAAIARRNQQQTRNPPITAHMR